MWTQVAPQYYAPNDMMETERWEYRRDSQDAKDSPAIAFVYQIDDTWYVDCIFDGSDHYTREDAMYVVEEIFRDYDLEEHNRTVNDFLEGG